MKGREIPGAQAFEAAHYVVGIDELSGDCAEQVDREWNSTLPRGFACFRQAEGAESAIRFSHETVCVPVRVTVTARDRPDRIQTGLLADVGEDRAGRVE